MRKPWQMLSLALAVLLATAWMVAASPLFTPEVTDYGRNRYRTHYTPTEPEYPLKDAEPIWSVPLGLSRSQPLMIRRDWDGTGEKTRIFHLAGDRLWALDGEMIPPETYPGELAEAYRARLWEAGFILWSTAAESLCDDDELKGKDQRLELGCLLLEPRAESRPFASSQPAYQQGATPAADVLYAGFGWPASVVALRPSDGKLLGGYIIDTKGDRGIVGAPLLFEGDTVVAGTTSGHAMILEGLATGTPSARTLYVGGRISSSPVPMGESGFLIASDARDQKNLGSHGYLMSYRLPSPSVLEFTPAWPAAVTTPAGIPGEVAVDDETIYAADKFGRLYALRLTSGEMLWCRQWPDLGPCHEGGPLAPGFINNGPGVDETQVYFVFRNSEGPNQGGGAVVALDKRTGQLIWQQALQDAGNTAPVPMQHVVIVGDTGGFVRAFDKSNGSPVTIGGYPLQLTDEPYVGGTQGEEWWEPIGGTATQMTVAYATMLVGVNSETEERTLLKAFRFHPHPDPEPEPPGDEPEPPGDEPEPPGDEPEPPGDQPEPPGTEPPQPEQPDLQLHVLDTPPTADSAGFPARVRAGCAGCTEPLTTTVTLSLGGIELVRQAATFTAENGWMADLIWQSGPMTPGSTVVVLTTIDPDNQIAEKDETNNSLASTVFITAPPSGLGEDRWGSKLTH